MAKIIILDNNRPSAALLKRALEREDHQVWLVANWQELSAIIDDPSIDLVLIHQEDSQWTAFNQFKRTYHDIPVMLYVMPDYRWTTMNWIVRAVQEALVHMDKIDKMDPLIAWDTGFNHAGINHHIL